MSGRKKTSKRAEGGGYLRREVREKCSKKSGRKKNKHDSGRRELPVRLAARDCWGTNADATNQQKTEP